MTTVETPEDASPTTMTPPPGRSWRSALASTEIDTRLLGMVLALIAIWIAFHVLSDGNFLTARNLWNLSVQSTSVAIMATGMVLIIVSRNIDLSVGSLLGFLAYAMALVQTDGMFAFFGLDVSVDGLQGKAFVWVVALAFGILLGALIGSAQGLHHRLRRRPFLHRHPGRLPRLAGCHLPHGRQAGADARTARLDVPAARRRSQGVTRRVAELVARAPGVRGHRPEHLPRPPAPEAVQPRAAPDVGRRRAVRRRLRGRDRRGRVRRQQLPVPGHRQGHRHRLPGRDPDRGDAADELPRPAPPLRSLRVRVRRQPRGGRARRHQHPSHRHVDVRAHGRAVRRERGDPDGSSQRRDHQSRGYRTSSTSSRLRSSVAPRSPAASGRSRVRCWVPSSCSRCARAWCC